MSDRIEAILFDMGGTLRRTTRRGLQDKIRAVRQIMELIGSDADVEEFTRLLSKRARGYKRWAEDTLMELGENEIWTRWMLPDWPVGKISKISVQLNQIWRDAIALHRIFPEAKEVVLTLFRRGYRLGLVSNTTSSIDVPLALEELGIAGCFETIVLSCVRGTRKPDPAILLDAAKRIGVRPEHCAYIGDQPHRDVAATRAAGFGRAVILRDARRPAKSLAGPGLAPDHIIDNLKELLVIFPARRAVGGTKQALERPVYDASISSMWGVKKFSEFEDFFVSSRRLGFARIELNHQVRSEMLAGINLRQYQFSSIHEPCPAVITAERLKKQDLLISSPDEERRRQGVESIKRSIDLARTLSARTIVVHAGQVQADGVHETKLRALFERGQAGSAEYLEIKEQLVNLRASLAGPCLQAVKKSLVELLEYAGRFNIRLGLENRYHYFDLPILDEMGQLLDLADSDRLGFLYDVGHAQTQDRLGFIPHEAWLKRFAGRMIGAHIHDVIGIQDHRAPGLGEVDFRMVAAYLPQDAFRTIEVMSFNTPEQIRAGLKILVDTGCVNIVQ